MPDIQRRKPVVSTRTGDDGYTGVLGSDRLPKHDRRVEALGDLDEASSSIGVARAISPVWLSHLLRSFQSDLYLAMADAAVDGKAGGSLGTQLSPDRVAHLDATLEDLRSRVSLAPAFVIPGDSQLGASLDMARAIVRRAERRVAYLEHSSALANQQVLLYLNRLSDVLFVAARVVDSGAEASEPAQSVDSSTARMD